MKVYVLTVDEYDSAHTIGVYSTPEKGMAAWQPQRPTSPTSVEYNRRYAYTWGPARDEDHTWWFDAWGSHVGLLQEFEVDVAG